MEFLWGILYFFLLVLIIIAAYFSSRFLASRPMGMAKGRYISVVDRVVLGRDKSILIIRVGEKIHLLTEGQQGFNIISELEDSDLIGVHYQNTGEGFKSIMNSYLSKKEEKKSDEKGTSSLSLLNGRISDSLRNIRRHNDGGKEQMHEKE